MARVVIVSNGTEQRTLEAFERDGKAYLWDRTADPRGYGDATEIADTSDMSIADAIRENGFEILEADHAE